MMLRAAAAPLLLLVLVLLLLPCGWRCSPGAAAAAVTAEMVWTNGNASQARGGRGGAPPAHPALNINGQLTADDAVFMAPKISVWARDRGAAAVSASDPLPDYIPLPDAPQHIYASGVPHTTRSGRMLDQFDPTASFFPRALYGAITQQFFNPYDSELAGGPLGPVANYSFAPVAAAGFNAIVATWQRIDTVLPDARRHNLSIISQPHDLGQAHNMSTDPNMLAWMPSSVPSEPTGALWGQNMSGKFKLYQQEYRALKKADPLHPIFILDCAWLSAPDGWWTKWNTAGDITCHDNYPLPLDSECQKGDHQQCVTCACNHSYVQTLDTGTGIPSSVRKAVAVNNESKPMWLVVQAFAQPNPKGGAFFWKLPTPAELKAMVWAGVVHGATGIVMFAQDNWQTRSGQVIGISPTTPMSYANPEAKTLVAGNGSWVNASVDMQLASKAAWNAAADVNIQLEFLKPWLLSPTAAAGQYTVAYSGKAVSKTPLRTLLKHHGDSRVLVVVNLDNVPLRGQFQLQEPIQKDVEAMFEEGRRVHIDADGSSFDDVLEPFGVHIYKIKTDDASVSLSTESEAAEPLDTVLEFEAGSSWEKFNYPAMCDRANGLGEGVGPDSMPIAWHNRRTNTTYFMAADHRHMFAGTGPTLDNLRNCSSRVFASTNASTPQSYANFQWLQSVRVFANGTAAGLAHNEFKGEFPADTGMAYCSRHCADSSNKGNWRGCRDQICEIWSTGLVASADSGATFQLAARPPHHLVAALPHRYVKDQPISGYGAISNGMQRGADGGFYGLINAVNQCTGANASTVCGAIPSGNCVFRAGDLTDPASFRARDAAGEFTVEWASAYLPGGETKGVCATIPVTEQGHFGEHVSFRKVVPPAEGSRGHPTFIALGDTTTSTGSVKYSLTYKQDFGAAMRDINASWGRPKLLALSLPGSADYHYPTLLDVRSPELGLAGGSVAAQEDGDSYALVSYPHPAQAPILGPVDAVRVAGAGCSACNGLYVKAVVPPGFGSASHLFELDKTHALYLNGDIWHIARLGKEVFYASSAPVSPGGGPPAMGWAPVTAAKPAPQVAGVHGQNVTAVSSSYVYLRGGQGIMRRKVQLRSVVDNMVN
jgi:hypothetical protein